MLNWVELCSSHLISWEYRILGLLQIPQALCRVGTPRGETNAKHTWNEAFYWRVEEGTKSCHPIWHCFNFPPTLSMLFFCHYELLLTHSLLPLHFPWFRFSLRNSLVQIPKAKLIVWNDHMHPRPYLQLWTTFFKFQKHFIDSSRIVFRSLSPAPSPPSSSVRSTLNPCLESEFLITQVFWPSHGRPEVSYG